MGVNLTKEVEDLHTEKYKTWKDLNKQAFHVPALNHIYLWWL